jgi:glycosyltransferase involved in cell wall biosynthesis
MTDVSVVMATWNRTHFLRATMDSVLAQTHRSWEMVIGDDGSDAPTRRLLEGYAAMPGIRVLWRSHCGNPAEVRNAAIREASGRYIAFLDSDDLWHADKLARQLAMMRERPECRWSYTASTCIDAQDRPLTFAHDPPILTHVGRLVESLATFNTGVALPTVLVERKLLLEAGLFDEGLGCYDDYDLYLRLAARSEVAAVSEPLVKVRQHGAHFSRGNSYATLSAREKFLGRAIAAVREPSVSTQLRRMRALNLAQLANLAAIAGDSREAALRLRGSLENGWSVPRWWLNAARVQSQFLSQRFKRILERRR